MKPYALPIVLFPLLCVAGCRSVPSDADPLIPESMRVQWNPGVEGGIPEIPVQVRLLVEDLPADGQDATDAIQVALNSIEGPGAVLLPAGEFILKKRLYIPSGVVLRGQGPSRTHLLLQHSSEGGNWYGAIVIKGDGPEEDRQVMSPVSAGAEQVKLSDIGGIEPGQLVWLFMHNDPEVMYNGRPEWNTNWANRAVGQMFRIEAVQGNSLILDRPVRLDYPEERRPGVRIYSPSRAAGLESIHFKMLDGTNGGIVTFETAENGWIRDCEFENSMGTHIGMRRSKNISVVYNYIHHGQRYSGGRAYGIGTDWSTTDCLIANNILSVLRHAVSTSLGANGCVWAYNYLREQTDNSPKDRLRDISLHGNFPYMNLFEGNVAEFAASSDWWGSSGPLNTFFRNRFDPSTDDPSGWIPPLQIQYHSHQQVVVGNSFVRNQGISVMDGCRDTLIDGNLIHGTIQWEQSGPKPIPDSLYLSEKPAFWGAMTWPGIGADVDADTSQVKVMQSLPAMDWFKAIQRAGRTIRFEEHQEFLGE